MPGEPAGSPAKRSQLHILKINLIKMMSMSEENEKVEQWFREHPTIPYHDYFVGLNDKEKMLARSLVYHVSRAGVDHGLIEFFMHCEVEMDILESGWFRFLEDYFHLDIVQEDLP